MVKWLTALMLMLPLSGLQAQEAPPINLEKWVAENYTANANYHFTLVILQSGFSDDGDPVLADVEPADIEKISMFKLVNSKSLAWDLKLNAPLIAGASVREKLEKLTDATYYLFVPKKGRVVFARRDSNGAIEELFGGKFSKDQQWTALISWIQKKFGWDGIVLAAEGSQLIAAAPAAYLKDDIQALAIAGSVRSDILTQGERTGAGLLSLVRAKNGFALFESVFVDESSKILPGTKLIIEKRKK